MGWRERHQGDAQEKKTGDLASHSFDLSREKRILLYLKPSLLPGQHPTGWALAWSRNRLCDVLQATYNQEQGLKNQ